MKVVAKIFIIISMVCGFWCILPLIFGIKALKKIKNDEVTTGSAVCTLLFCNTLAGILMFFMRK